MITFKEYLNELRFYPGIGINKKNITLDNAKIEYKGKTQILYKTPEYFILTDLNDKVMFYLGYFEGKSKNILLNTRENVSDKKELFFRVIYTLLFLGYQIREDYQHNEKSLKAILGVLKRGHIIVKYNDEDITQDLIDKNFDDNTDNTFTYEIHNRDSQYLVERYIMWENQDLFDTAYDFAKTTLKD